GGAIVAAPATGTAAGDGGVDGGGGGGGSKAAKKRKAAGSGSAQQLPLLGSESVAGEVAGVSETPAEATAAAAWATKGTTGMTTGTAAAAAATTAAALVLPPPPQQPSGVNSSGNNSSGRKAVKLTFALSGFSSTERGQVAATLKQLRLPYIPINNEWDPRINALLAPSLKRSDKTVCAMAAGAWLLRADYLHAYLDLGTGQQQQQNSSGGGAGAAAGTGRAWLDPAAYELRECEDGPSVISTGAPAHWRQRAAARASSSTGTVTSSSGTSGRGGGAFSGLRLFIPPGLPAPLDSATLGRMLAAGGGVAVTAKAGGSAAALAAAARGCHAGVVPPEFKQ
ncbi:hypothetical protein Agub_g14788, partial [Astrephomene gubernaculifera]